MTKATATIEKEQSERVLHMVGLLALEAEDLLAATVDAAFYWGCCRLDFIRSAGPLREEFDRDMAALAAEAERVATLWRQVGAARASEPGKQLWDYDERAREVQWWQKMASRSRSESVEWWQYAVAAMSARTIALLDIRTGQESDRTIELRESASATWKAFSKMVSLAEEKYPIFAGAVEDDDLTPFEARIAEVARRFGVPRASVMAYVTRGVDWITPHTWRHSPVFSEHSDPSRLESIVLDVFSGSFDGEQVAALLDFTAKRLECDERIDKSGPPSVQLQFEFLTDEESTQRFVRVTAGVPLPPAVVVEHAYDAIVDRERGWRSELRHQPPETRQRTETAIRTWGVALLCSAGWTTHRAIAKVCERAGWDAEVSQERFNQDRRALVERFPAAEPYLFVRRRSATKE